MSDTSSGNCSRNKDLVLEELLLSSRSMAQPQGVAPLQGWSERYSQGFRGISSHKRSCTDLYCLTVLLIFICGWLAVGYYAYWNGDMLRLTSPKDSHGRTCGIDEDVKDNKYLLFYDITKCVSFSVFLFGCPTKQICIKRCPDESWFSDYWIENPPLNWRNVQEKLICEDPAVAKSVNSKEALQAVMKNEKCAPYYVNTSAFFHMCIPNPLSKNDIRVNINVTGRSTTAAAQTQNYFNYVYEVSNGLEKDLIKCWRFVLLFVITALVACLFTILIMGIVTKIFVWIALSLILILLCGGTVVAFIRYDSIPATESVTTEKEGDSDSNKFYSETLYGQLQWLFEQKQTWLVLTISSGVLFILFALLVIFLRSRISLAILLIGEGSKAVNSIKSTLCIPMITRIFQFAVLIWFVLIFLYVKSLGNSVYKVQGLSQDKDCHCNIYRENDWCLPRQFDKECSSISLKGPCVTAKCAFSEFRSPKLKFYFQLYNFFGLLWGVYFVSGFTRLILSLCFKTWYWTYNKHEVPFFTLLYSIIIAIRYHLGTIAMGSFLIATCGFIRAMLERVQRMVKNTDGLIMQCSMWSLRCCFWMLQKFLIFISNNAYIMCAIMGHGFFHSAQEAFNLLTRNLVRVIVLDKVLDFLMLVGKLAVTVVVVIISYFTFSAGSLQLNYPWVVTIFIGIITWIISSAFFGVYSIAVDTLFLSFLRDSELNDGSQNKPYYMSPKMKYILKENVHERKMNRN
ncbi:hypothetical protein V9T40_000919 [Parthenolecanium corni]|uniref:Choline transporter-like protein n=1 Tax=Parthenolecanium corni TaxID=536013 RepID=A0AAN9TAN1_9HEMI